MALKLHSKGWAPWLPAHAALRLSLTQVTAPPGLVIPPDLEAVLRENTVPGLYTADVLLRYCPSGYTGHLGEDGLAREAPPKDKVLEDWASVGEGARPAAPSTGREPLGLGGGAAGLCFACLCNDPAH